MRRPVELSLSLLESREVPAAGLFADLRPGVWGSNPTTHGVSGDTLYFSANNIYQGTELWATDGTAAGTRMVKDLNPGKPGSGIFGLPAGGGVMYLIQTNEGSNVQNDYKTDGTAAGTVPIANGIKGLGGQHTVGWKGELYAYVKTATPDVWSLVKSDGNTVTVLTTFNGQPLETYNNEGVNLYLPLGPALQLGGTDKLEFTVKIKGGGVEVWQTDGTAAGTVAQQTNLSATSPTTGEVKLQPGTPIGGGQYLFVSEPDYQQNTSSLWVGDGTTTRNLVRTFSGVVSPSYWENPNIATTGGKSVFTVTTSAVSPAADIGVWVTDGTAAGTSKLNLPSVGGRHAHQVRSFDGKVVLAAPTADNTKWTFHQFDGTATTAIPIPAGTSAVKWQLKGVVPADAANPKGFLLFQEDGTGKAYRTDGTAAGTALLDMTGLPKSSPVGSQFYWQDYNDSVSFGTMDDSRGFYFKGAVYYPGRNPDFVPYTQEWVYGKELWKWDLAGVTTPTPSPAPKVTGTMVNDGGAQRSMVKTLTVTFDTAVTVDPAGVTIYNVRGDTTHFSMQFALVNGKTVLTFTFPNGIGGSIADGRWTLRINAGAVKSVVGGTAMAANHSFTFTRLYGDTSGDGVYDRSTRTLVKALLGQEVGDPGYRWDLDVNDDGKIDSVDELAAIRNWGKGV